MRREEKEIKDFAIIEGILTKAQVGRIALIDKNQPYIVPVNFGYKDNAIYFHSANEGRKIDILKKNNSVCFQTEVQHELVKSDVACRWSAKYLSVIAFGKAHFITDSHKKKHAFDIIMNHYSPGKEYEYSEENLKSTSIIKIEIEVITGKNSGC